MAEAIFILVILIIANAMHRYHVQPVRATKGDITKVTGTPIDSSICRSKTCFEESIEYQYVCRYLDVNISKDIMQTIHVCTKELG